MVNFSKLTVEELERILDAFPWFTLARNEYVRRHMVLGSEAVDEALADAGLFLLSRGELRCGIKKEMNGVKTTACDEENTVGKAAYYVPGVDYFGKEDFAELERRGEAFDISALKYNPIASALKTMGTGSETERMPGQDTGQGAVPCTETLARIYFDQQLYDKAIDLYEKLILLYPEKNAYFANLIEEAKKVKQQ